MSPAKFIPTFGVYLIISAACFFLNIIFPLLALVVLYFCMRFMLKIFLESQGVAEYKKYKWLWIGLFAFPYPLVIIHSFFITEFHYYWQNYLTVVLLFCGYTALVVLFGERISRALLKKNEGLPA